MVFFSFKFVLIATSAVSPAQDFDPSSSVWKRALPDSPSKGYAPAVVDCPANRPVIRKAEDLSSDEKSWLKLRRKQTVEPLTSWLSRIGIPGIDTTSYIKNLGDNTTMLPNIGIAISGGGYRALMNGGGFLAAADSRVENSTNAGHIGGLLQATTYVSGLSGGAWLVGSMFVNNFSSVQNLRDGSKGSGLWKFGNSVLRSPKTHGSQIIDDVSYFRTILNNVETKADAGYNTSLTDYWGRALSFQLINDTNGGPAYTFSSIALQDNFKEGSIPFPIIVATNGEDEGTRLVSVNSTVYEVNPFELGSWDSTTNAFAPTRYIGSNFSAGAVPMDGSCVRGFDQAGFLMGTSSSLFNQVFRAINQTSLPGFIQDVFKKISARNNDIAQFQPNPFFGFNTETNRIAQSIELSLADGGLDGQNIPLIPLIQPRREVDVIFAIDSSADTTFRWPNGTSLVATYERSLNDTVQSGISFPSIPDQNTFINLGLNNRPTFFGCDASNITGKAPLIVYIPNAPYVVQSNASTFNSSYTDNKRNLIIRNGYEVATISNSTLDPHWPTCIACAVMSRSFTKTKTANPPACQSCFQRYCWDGTLNSTAPATEYAPKNKVTSLSSAFRLYAGDYISFSVILVMIMQLMNII